MLYPRGRKSLSDPARTGSVQLIFTTGGCFGSRPTLYRVKDANESSMGRGNQFITQFATKTAVSRFAVRVLPLALLIGCATAIYSTPARAQSAGAWNKRGVNAEAREDFDGAYEAYRQAPLKDPKD